jgi:pimeloyl-ACP methyl ester carboxylesterase
VKTITCKKDGTNLDCVVFGKGAKTLVLIPGLSFQRVKGAALPLAYMYRAFTKDYTVYVMDKKDTVPDGYTIRDMAEDTAFMMEYLRLSAADVVGVSQGGMIAQYLAIRHPGLVHKLVLCVTASRISETMEKAINRWIWLAREGDYARLVADMFEKMYSEAYRKKNRRLIPLLSRIGRPKDYSRFIALAEACLTCNAYPELHQISCPAFVIGGKEDQVAAGSASEEIAGKLSCEIYMYEALGHAAYEEAKDFNQRILRFLQEPCFRP